jgi:UrcA family protein
MSRRFRHTLSVLGAFAMMGANVLAVAQSPQTLPEVVVMAYAPVTRLGRDAHGRFTEVMRLSREVSYADLDVSTHSGAIKLEARIKDAAKAVCKELNAMYPMGSEVDLPSGSCVREATKSARSQLKAAIVYAENARSAGSMQK